MLIKLHYINITAWCSITSWTEQANVLGKPLFFTNNSLSIDSVWCPGAILLTTLSPWISKKMSADFGKLEIYLLPPSQNITTFDLIKIKSFHL